MKLNKLDEVLYNFLKRNVEVMPLRFVKLIAFYYTDARIRKLYLRRLGVNLGEGTYTNLGLKLVNNDEDICVNIGKNVSIGPGLTLICHSLANNSKGLQKYIEIEKIEKNGKIEIEEEVWIGANVTILPGIKIGKFSVIGAGSVVTKDIEAFTINTGVPCKKIRKIQR